MDEGNTIPFIARYRKEMTDSLDDQVLRELYDRLVYLRSLEAKRDEVRRLIEELGQMTSEVSAALDRADSLAEIEDIYRPFRPKRRTRASIAREKGLGPLADILLLQDPRQSPEAEALPFVDAEKGVNDVEEALQGAQDIVAELVSDNAEYRKFIRELTQREGFIATAAKKKEDSPYRMYYEYRESASRIAPHRVSAIDRGEREGFLSVKLEAPEEIILNILKRKTLKNQSSMAAQVETAVEDAYERLIKPSIETEVRNALSDAASEKAIRVFSQNLKGLLMQPPVQRLRRAGPGPGLPHGLQAGRRGRHRQRAAHGRHLPHAPAEQGGGVGQDSESADREVQCRDRFDRQRHGLSRVGAVRRGRTEEP